MSLALFSEPPLTLERMRSIKWPLWWYQLHQVISWRVKSSFQAKQPGHSHPLTSFNHLLNTVLLIWTQIQTWSVIILTRIILYNFFLGIWTNVTKSALRNTWMLNVTWCSMSRRNKKAECDVMHCCNFWHYSIRAQPWIPIHILSF